MRKCFAGGFFVGKSFAVENFPRVGVLPEGGWDFSVSRGTYQVQTRFFRGEIFTDENFLFVIHINDTILYVILFIYYTKLYLYQTVIYIYIYK